MNPKEASDEIGTDKPSRLSALMARLHKGGQLPALDTSITDICSLAEGQKTSTADLASVVLRDCSLTSSVIAAANSVIYHSAEPIQSVSMAILVMGFEPVKEVALGHEILKQISQLAKDRNLYRLFACSYFSGMLATALGERLGHQHPEELRVAGVLSELPRLLLANAFPEEYALMQQRILRDHQPLAQACLETFGVNYDELARAIARHWNLPANVAATMKGDPSSDPVRGIIRNACQIADMMFGNVPAGEAALKTVEKELETKFHTPGFELPDFISQAAGADPNVARFFRLNPKDVDMMVRIAEWGRVNPTEVASMLTFGAATEEFQAKTTEDPAIVVGRCLTDLVLATRRPGADINRILLAALEGVYRSTNPACVIMAFPDSAKRQLEGRFCLGGSPPIKGHEFRVALTDETSPVARCWHTKQLLRVPTRPGLPLPVLERLHVGSVLLAPVVARGNAIGLCLVGRKGNAAFTDQEVQWLEAITCQIGLAFELVRPAG